MSLRTPHKSVNGTPQQPAYLRPAPGQVGKLREQLAKVFHIDHDQKPSPTQSLHTVRDPETEGQSGQRDRTTPLSPGESASLSTLSKDENEYLTVAFELARQAPVPPAAQRYQLAALRLLACLCRELQRLAGDSPFYLSCRTAGRLVGISHQDAHRLLWKLVHDGIITIARPGTPGAGGKATRYFCACDQAPSTSTSTSTTSMFTGTDQESADGPYRGDRR